MYFGHKIHMDPTVITPFIITHIGDHTSFPNNDSITFFRTHTLPFPPIVMPSLNCLGLFLRKPHQTFLFIQIFIAYFSPRWVSKPAYNILASSTLSLKQQPQVIRPEAEEGISDFQIQRSSHVILLQQNSRVKQLKVWVVPDCSPKAIPNRYIW